MVLCIPAVLFVWERGPRIGLFWVFAVVLCVVLCVFIFIFFSFSFFFNFFIIIIYLFSLTCFTLVAASGYYSHGCLPTLIFPNSFHASPLRSVLKYDQH